MWRFIGLVALLLGLVGGAFYFMGQSEKLATTTDVDLEDGDAIVVKNRLSLGGVPAPQTPSAYASLGAFREPVQVTGCTLTAIAEQPVGARADGKLQDNLVQLGEHVAPGKSLGQMDESLARLAVRTARVKAESNAAINTARDKMNATREFYEREKEVGRGGSQQELRIREFQYKEAQGEYIKALDEKTEAERLLEQKKHELELLKLVSDIEGTVVRVNKKPGSPVRAGETLYEVVDIDRLYVEGLVPRESAAGLKTGMRARVEPERLEAPERELRLHTAPVTGLATSPDGRFLASCGEDGRVVIWDWRAGTPLLVGKETRRLVEFLAVAFSPVVEEVSAGVRQYRLLVGGADGVARLWTFQQDASGRVKADAPKEIKKEGGGHTGRIQALAFTPDGKHAVTGATDFNIFLWNLEKGDVAYKVQARKGSSPAHRGFVTSLAICSDPKTKELFLVSAATDKTIKRWLLGEEGAQLLAAYDGRTGDVGHLSVLPDGKSVLFDHADQLRIVNLIDGSVEGIMHSRYGNFRNLALAIAPAASVGPDGSVTPAKARMTLTTTAQGRLQLLSMPPSREQEIFFRKAMKDGFRRNSLLVLGELLPGNSASLGLDAVLASLQPKAAPLPRFRMSPGFPVAAAPQMMPLLVADVSKHEGLAAVPELWNLGSYELRNLKTADGAGVTCGAAAPSLEALFTAGNDRVIRVWSPPAPQEQDEAIEAVITYVGAQAETTATPLVRIQAQLDNPTDPARRLMPNTKVSLMIFPEAAK